jgi:predicted nucleic acid-binding protein
MCPKSTCYSTGSKYHEPCTKFVRKLCKENVPSLVSNLTLDEIWYSLIKVSLIKDFGDKYASLLFAIFPRMTRKWYVEIRDDPEILRNYVPLIKRVMADTSMLQNVILVEVKTEMTLKAIDFIGKYSLLPRDAIHLATMLGLGVKNIVTTDIDFTRVKDINVYTCNYKVPGQIK